MDDTLPKYAGVERLEKFVPFIAKQDESDPECRIVSGCATDPTIDHDKQMCDPLWLKTAMSDYSKWANIREMHQPIAAGVAISIIPQGDAYYVTSRIVDAGSVKKLDAGVLKGYSIGISHPVVVRDNKAIGGRIVGGEIIEISLVDRPCNPTAMLDSIEVDKIEKVILWEKADELDTPTTQTETLDKSEGSEMIDSRLALTAASAVRTLMQREVAEGAEPGEGSMCETMSTLGYIYDCLLGISKKEMNEAWGYLSQQVVSELAAKPEIEKGVTMEDETKVMTADEIKAFLPELEKALSKGDRAVLHKAHHMIADMCNKGDTCKEYMTTSKSVDPDVTKGDCSCATPGDCCGTETTETPTNAQDLTKTTETEVTTEVEGTAETSESQSEDDPIVAMIRETNRILTEQLEAVKEKLAGVDEKVKAIGAQPDDSNAPFLSSLPTNRVNKELEGMKSRVITLNNTADNHPDGIVRQRAMAELRKVRKQIEEIENV